MSKQVSKGVGRNVGTVDLIEGEDAGEKFDERSSFNSSVGRRAYKVEGGLECRAVG